MNSGGYERDVLVDNFLYQNWQSNSEGGQCAISQTTLDHLITVAEKLALVEVELYQKGVVL